MYLLLTLVQTLVVFGVIPAALIFSLAGRWDLWNVWAYLGIAVTMLFFRDVVMYRNSPGLLKERLKPSAGGRDGRLVVIGVLALLCLFSHWGIAGLDQHFHWSDIIPPAGVAAGLVIFAMGIGLAMWPMLVNPFFSSAVRIQEDRGQQVISSGPYAIVRHPGYAGLLLGLLASGVALNSLLAIIPIVIGLPFVVRRTMIEDRMLRDELAGYADYTAKVRYRLIPGVW